MKPDYRRTKALPPYDKEGRTSFPTRNVPGVYLIYRVKEFITGNTKELRYVGFSRKDVYKALYRHFQAWNDRQVEAGMREPRTVFKLRHNVVVRVIYCRTAAQAVELEKALIIKHRPPDNPDKLELYTLTDHGKELANMPTDADLMPDPNEAPF